jgi:hypothetical protein
MRTVDCTRALSPRRRAALRLDLDDRQSTLIRELLVMACELAGDDGEGGVPEAWRLERDRDDAVAGRASLPELRSGLTELYRIDRAIVRLEGEGYGVCTACGRPIDFHALSADPLRTRCSDGCGTG